MMNLLLALAFLVILIALGREIRARLRQRPRGDAQSQPRFKGSSTAKLVEDLTDPRDAAAILLVQTALDAGHIGLPTKQVIVALMQDTFDTSAEEAEGLFSFGRMAVGQIGDVHGSVRRLIRPISESCTLEEMKGLVRMMETVAQTEGPTPAQRAFIAEVCRTLRLPLPDAA